MNTGINKQEYFNWLSEIKGKVKALQIKAAVAVNQTLLALYWDLGKMIAEKQLSTKWGDKLLEQLSKNLSKEFPYMNGFSRINLFYMQKLYLFYNQDNIIVPQLVEQLQSAIKDKIIPQLVEQLHNAIKNQNVQQVVGHFPDSVKNQFVQQPVGQLQNDSHFIISQIITKIPWGHNCVIQVLKILKTNCQNIYEKQTLHRRNIPH
ncbi:MAG: hypothetical protein HY738_17690 [Bacteroidia bacterium]|nr:hypothetical protein [Bacteroidia bacterium]